MQQFQNQALLSKKEVLHLLNMSPSTWERFMGTEEGKRFPCPVSLGKLGGKKEQERWLTHEVLAFLSLLPRIKNVHQTPPNSTK